MEGGVEEDPEVNIDINRLREKTGSQNEEHKVKPIEDNSSGG